MEFATLLEHLPVALVTLEQDVCTYGNPAAHELLGGNPIGKPIDDLLRFCQKDPLRLVARTRSGRYVKGVRYALPDGTVALTFGDITDEMRAQRESTALARMASGLTWSGSLDETMESLAINATQAVDAEAAAVVLQESGAPRIAGSHNLPMHFLDCLRDRYRHPDKRNFFASAMESRQVTVKQDVLPDLLEDPCMAPCADYVRHAPWHMVVIVPMYYRDTGLGTLNCYFTRCQSLDEEELRFLQVIADQAAVLVQNARLINEVRDKALLQERQRLARELHDSVSQALYGIALGARTARTLADRDPSAVKEPLDYVLSLAEAGLAEMRALIFELRPETIDSEGLVAALERHLAALQARHHLQVESRLPTEPPLSSEGRHALYRVAQEALNNIVKHASASHVDLQLQSHEGHVKLSIADDGRGFAGPGDVPGHLGLRSMRERMQTVGGSLQIDSTPGQGTRVLAIVPASSA